MGIKLFKKNEKSHILYSLYNKKWVYVSYIPDVYYRKKDTNYMLSHQNKREALIIGKVFHSLGYNVKIALYNASEECDDRCYDIVFGLEPNFVTMCQKNPQALKIYYATGAYWEHQFTMVKSRTDQFNKAQGSHLAYSRLVEPHISCDIADAIFQIGSSFTLQTYPADLRNKIQLVNQSSNFTQSCDLEHKLQSVSTNDFLWFGSTGSILKGLDLVIDYFIHHPQYKLHVVGPIDDDFMDYYQKQITGCQNITFYGFLNTRSEEFIQLAYLCSFNIFPSASEGCPGSVITLMQMGVIPIVSQWGAVDKIEQYGYLLPELSVEAIGKAVEWAKALPPHVFQKLIEENMLYSRKTWNLEQFEKDFRASLQKALQAKRPYILYDSQIFDQQKFGGISRYFCEIISHLQFNYDIAVRYTENQYLPQANIDKHYQYLPSCLLKRYRPMFYHKNWRLLKKLQKTQKPHLFHPTYYNPSFLPLIGNNPYVVTVHDMIYERFPEYFANSEEVIRQKKEIITRANRIIAISEYTKKDIIELLNIDPQKIEVVYHGTSLQMPQGKYKLSLPEQYILFIGERGFYKNFQTLLKAFHKIHQTDKDLHLICTGSPFSESEQQQLSDLEITASVQQISIDDKRLAELYHRALLFVYPSCYEGFGISILEAYACNCPVALSNTTCFPEIAGDAGAYFDPYSIDSMTNCIRAIIHNNPERTRLIHAGQERLKLYSWEKAARETEKVYLKTLQQTLTTIQ